jgi:hypothetical protein
MSKQPKALVSLACILAMCAMHGCAHQGATAPAKPSAPPQNLIDAPNNQGIATQGQVGNNTIINPPVPAAAKPDVVLRFVYPTYPALVLQNTTDAIARDMLWQLALWNLDLPERTQPLAIPATPYGWLRPRASGGPQDLFSNPQVASLLKPGDRLCGTALVSCPECKRSHTYVVFIKWGESGWYAETNDAADGDLLIPRGTWTAPVIAAYAQGLENSIPVSERIPISPP